MSLRTRVLEALRWTTGTRLAGYALAWTINVGVIRLLSPADYGLFAVAVAWAAFVELLSGFGQRTVLVQRARVDEPFLRRLVGALLLWNLALLALCQAAAPALGAFYDDARLVPLFRVLAVSAVLGSTVLVPTALRWRAIDFQAVSLVGLAQAVATSLVVLALALLDLGAWALVGGQLAGTAVLVAGTLRMTGFRLRPDLRVRGLGADLRFGGQVVSRTLVALFETRIDAILIGKLLGPVPLGAWAVAGALARQPSRALLQPVVRVARPAFASLRDDPTRLRAQFLRGVEAITLVFVPILWGLGLVAPELVTGVLGARWEPAVPLLRILCLVLPLRSVLRILPPLFDALGRPELALRHVATTAACVPIGVVLGAPFGIAGVAAGWSLAVAVAMAVNLARALPVLDVQRADVWRAARPGLVAGVAMAGAVLAARATVLAELAPLARLPLAVALGAAVYAGVLWTTDRSLVARYRELALGARDVPPEP